ncbi:MAG: BON domain-containing protein, partial [Spirochaetaceae bacterium]|nr:BON domain-containing protein [Spirochaetaceae bacterium]
IPPAACAKIIIKTRDFINAGGIAENPDLTKKRLDELRLAQKIVHHIVYEKLIPVHFLDVSIQNGKAVLYGVANTLTTVDTALEAAGETPGVQGVVSEIKVIQDYTVFH